MSPAGRIPNLPDVPVVRSELGAWCKDSAGELRTYASLLAARAEAAHKAADLLDPPKRRRKLDQGVDKRN